MIRNLIILIALFFFSFNLFAQDKECGMESHMHEMMKDPEFAHQWEINQKKFKETVRARISNEFGSRIMDPVVIPVAVHFPGGQESDRACLEALAQNLCEDTYGLATFAQKCLLRRFCLGMFA